jgi:glycosyltransferase involved in cell wall biosynthesis
VLYVSRLEPENNALAVLRAYRDVPGETPLVLVGDAPYAADYIAQLRREADPRVKMPGAIYGEGYRELLAHAAVYVQATEVGGTHPALVEAMGYGRVVCYNATPENEEVAGGAALPFDVNQPGTLARLLKGILDDPGAQSVWKERARTRTRERYRWDDVVDRYVAVLEAGEPLA